MEVEFADPKLEELLYDPRAVRKWPPGVIYKYRQRITLLMAVKDKESLYRNWSKGVGLEELKGKRAGQCSMRLNRQWRLIFSIREDKERETAIILEIGDYH